MSQKNQKIKINAFCYEIKTPKIDSIPCDFQELFKNKLASKESLESKFILDSTSSALKNGYLILSSAVFKNTIFGVFVKFSEEKPMTLSINDFQKKSIELEKIKQHNIKKYKGIVKNYYYFCIYNNVLLFNNKNIIRSFEKYINDLFTDDKLNFAFNQILEKIDSINLGDIKSIKIKNGYLDEQLDDFNKNFFANLRDLLSKFGPNIDTNNLKDEIEAELLLKIKGNHKNILQVAIRNVSSENLYIYTTDGKVIKGEEILKKFVGEVEINKKNNLLNEDNIKEFFSSKIKSLSQP